MGARLFARVERAGEASSPISRRSPKNEEGVMSNLRMRRHFESSSLISGLP
jgi:hypothetical protein